MKSADFDRQADIVTLMAGSPPERTLEQRLAALQRSKEVRQARANDKKLIRARQLDARDLLREPPEHWQAARIAELLLAVPSVGHTKVEKTLRTLKISPSRTISGLTVDQADRLCGWLGKYCQSARGL